MKMKKIMPEVKAVRSQTSFSTSQVSFLLKIASSSEPKPPTPAASVGVAQPAKIEPSTMVIRNTGGRKPFSSIRIMQPAVSGPMSSDSDGAHCGFSADTTRM